MVIAGSLQQGPDLRHLARKHCLQVLLLGFDVSSQFQSLVLHFGFELRQSAPIGVWSGQ